MGFRLSGEVLETVTGLTPAQKLMLLGLAERADRQGRYAFPSVATLSRYAECSERTVELGLQALVAGGWISVQRKATNRMPTTYVVNVERLSRGEESSPQRLDLVADSRGEETSPQANSRGEVFSTPGAKFSTSRGEETSPDPVSKEPIQQEPIQRASAVPTPRALVETWNAVREPGPKILELTPQRAAAYTRALVATPNLADWRVAIDWLNRQAYANAPGTGHNPTWRAGLDWLAKPGNLPRILEAARTDAAAPPGRPRRAGDLPTQGLDAADRDGRRQRRQAFLDGEAARADEAARLVLEMSAGARQAVEREALAALEEYRDRMSASQFDDAVLKQLPGALLALANGRPLDEFVAALEKATAA